MERKILGLYRIRERKHRLLFELTLPIEWIRRQGLKKSDKLAIIQTERGELLIRRP
jgi:hypothetical protein